MTEIFTISPFPGRDMCDFCADQPVAKIYGCHNFILPNTKQAVFQHGSIGAWAACSKCSQLIDEAKWTRLTDRSVRKFIQRHRIAPYDAIDVRLQLRQIHQLFRKHMIHEV